MKERLIEYWLRNRVVSDKRVINAFKKIPREEFIHDHLKEEAYEDVPLPIGQEQTISQPTTIMIMTQALDVKLGQKILEIGSGSGYQAALLSYLVGKNGKIFTIEIIPELVKFAKENLKKIKIKNVEVIHGDGSKGYKKEAPFDRVIVTAGAPETPKMLIEQLKVDGILVVPVGPVYSQRMLKITKKKGEFETEYFGDFVFVQLKGKYGWGGF